MAIDPKQLAASALRHQAAQRRTGASTFAAVREVLPTIRGLREKGVSWAAIAAALGEAGVTQGKDDTVQPITVDRLRAVHAQIVKADRKAEAKRANHAARPDIVAPSRSETARSKKLKLSDELGIKPQDDKRERTLFEGEDAIRQRDLAGVERLFKKGE
ncbi:hypothetical protein [Aurantimonas sp. VKM B-3413]|uniref:hypothetical protein n=1 Tax=Aurantimonas sp. VKM B-3413 TaxID=2779401 RepID=UPI001E53D263|nr:hypothetical protein [Aurantimonas sp. VKM B-3413]MCB8839361.1 hypothetical protein [Aurantimonas sp. VKM B-3413]